MRLNLLHRPFFWRRMVQWCTWQTHFILIWEVARYRLVLVWQNFEGAFICLFASKKIVVLLKNLILAFLFPMTVFCHIPNLEYAMCTYTANKEKCHSFVPAGTTFSYTCIDGEREDVTSKFNLYRTAALAGGFGKRWLVNVLSNPQPWSYPGRDK